MFDELLQHLYNLWLITTRIVAHKIFQKITLQAIKAREVSTSLLLIGGSLVGTWMRMLLFNFRAQRFNACYSSTNFWEQKIDANVEAHPMHGIAHLQITLKTKCSWLQTALYNYGNGASQEKVY